MNVEIVNKILAVCVIGSQIFIVLAVLYYLFLRKRYPAVSGFFADNGVKLAFVVSLAATVGSLFYSNVAGFIPCNLCWFQRIFMYPEVFILGLALVKKDTKIIDYTLLLAFIGWLISIYHNDIYYKGASSIVCRIGESCVTPYVTEFGYITIPMMAFTAFSLIIIFLLFVKQKEEI
jgi:disulfide bond formation protein DsbB